MNCYICGAEVLGAHTCPNCGADILLYRQIIYASDVYYNEGLSKAQVRDLSGAIASLRQSLSYNKYNSRARNLLGLVYFEIGEAVRGLNEWVICKSLDPNDTMADYFLDKVGNTTGYLEDIKSTIKKYNQALAYVKAGSRDLAIIQLKKILSTKHKMICAYHLLAICYIQEKRYHEARKLLLQAMKIDTGNTTTSTYLAEVKDLIKTYGGKSAEFESSIFEGGDSYAEDSRFKSFMETTRGVLLNIAIGCAIGVALSLGLIGPHINSVMVEEEASDMRGFADELTKARADASHYQSVAEELQSKLDGYEGGADVKGSYEELLLCRQAFEEGDNETAKSHMVNVNYDQLDDAGKEIYNSLSGTLMPYVVEEEFNNAIAFYEEANYSSAISNLTKVIEFDETYAEGKAIFMLADCLRLSGQTPKAAIYYTKCMELYPNNRWGRSAENYAKVISNGEPVGNEPTDISDHSFAEDNTGAGTTEVSEAPVVDPWQQQWTAEQLMILLGQ